MSATLLPLASISDLTTGWLSSALSDNSIKGFSTQRIGTGQVSFCYRVTLEYDQSKIGGLGNRDSSIRIGPRTVVVKMASSDPQSRGSGLGLGLYERETKWCTEIAPMLNTKSLAKSFYSHFAHGDFSILMEDAVDATPGDDLVGATPEQARIAVAGIAKIHAQMTLPDVREKAPWLEKGVQSLSREVFGALYTRFLEAFGPRIEAEHHAICERLLSGWESYNIKQFELEQGLVHGDFRFDNLLFGTGSVTIVDWQTVRTGAAMTDLAYFMGCSLHVEDRRKTSGELIKLYLSTLGGDMTLEQAHAGVRLQSLFGVYMSIVSSMMVERTSRGDEMFMTMFQRHCAQVLDLDALSLLSDSADLVRPWLEPASEDEGRHKSGIEYLWNESWYFDVVDEKQEIGCYIRMGLYPNQNCTWYTAVVCGPNIPTVAVLDYHAQLPNEHLVLRSKDLLATQTDVLPLKEYKVTLEAIGKSYATNIAMEEDSDAPSTPLNINLTWKTVCRPYAWRMTTRYEISCLVSGSLEVGGEHYDLDGCVGQRDHSWGVRDWWGLDWMWSALHLSDGKHIHAVNLRFPKMAPVNLGYVQDEQESHEITDVETEEVMTKNELIDRTKLAVIVSSGDKIQFEARPVGHGAIMLRAFDGRVSKFSRAWVKLLLDDGRHGVGWIEFNDALSEY